MAVLLAAQTAVAADIDGTWNLAIDTGAGFREFSMVIESTSDGVVATIGENKVKGTFDGTVLELAGEVFSAPEGYSAPMKLTGKLEDGKLSGDVFWDAYQVAFSATRVD
jgi:hypothetical protein